MRVTRTNEERILQDHEARIKRLEAAPGGSPIFIDKRILDAAADHVLFTGFPAGRTVMELTWNAILELGSVDPSFIGLLFNGDATHNDVDFFDGFEYRWNVGIPNDDLSPPATYISADDGTYYSNFGVVSWITDGRASVGRVRFPAYADEGGPGAGLGGYWSGDSVVGDANPGVCGGVRDDARDMLISALSMVAAADDDPENRQQFAAGSWFALTAY